MQGSATGPVKVGLVTDLSGPLAVMGSANANVARMVVDDLNAAGGLLGRRVELFVEDSETTDAVGAQKAAALVGEVGVDVILGGIYSSMRQAIKGPAVDEGRTLYIYPEQYEGQESDPLVFCTGPVPAQQVAPLIPWLMESTGARTFYLPSSDYIWPRVLNQRVREAVAAAGGEIVGEEYHPLVHTDFADTVARIADSGADVVFNTIVPPGLLPFLALLHGSGFAARGGSVVCTYMDENVLNLVPAAHTEGLYSCLDYYRTLRDPVSAELTRRYDARFPGAALFAAGSACTGLYRGLRFWESAVREAGSLDQADVVAALDRAVLTEGPGGPAQMVPGQHHCRMNMYIGRASGGRFEVVESLGMIDPQEAVLSAG